MKNIILIGMPGSGKSTIGVVLAKTLGMRFLDTDLIIQHNEGKLLQDIIDNEGLEAFVQAEEKAIISLKCENTVIATGGSVVLSEKSMQHLSSLGKIIYLKVSVKKLKKRIKNIKTRGIACKKGDSVETIYKKRKQLYEKYADFVVDSLDKNIEGTISNILKLL